MNPAHLFRKGVAALNEWFEKAEREELEQRMEVLGPSQQPRPASGHDPGGYPDLKAFDPRMPQTPPAGIAEVIPASRSRDPHNPVPHDTGPDASREHAGQEAVSAKPRHDEHGPSPDELLFAQSGDLQYRERNRLVRQIGERYSRYGNAVASAVLQKCLLADGVQMLVMKLGGNPEGDDEADHRQVVEFIERHGAEKFCEMVGVRGTSREPAPRHRPSADKFKVAQNLSGQGKGTTEKSLKMQLQRVNVTPVPLTGTPPGPALEPKAAESSTSRPTPFGPSTTPPTEEFHEPARPQKKDVAPIPLRSETAKAAGAVPPRPQKPGLPNPTKPTPLVRRVKARPLPDVKVEPKPETPGRTAADFLREVTEEED